MVKTTATLLNEALAGFAIEDAVLWPMILRLKSCELEFFGGPYHAPGGELKARAMLKKKTFRHASVLPPFDTNERRALARECLDDPTNISKKKLAALAQAKLAYVSEILQVCRELNCHAFASIIIDPTVEPGSFLRKDYAYLFERFYHFLADRALHHQGIVVFDETEKSKSHLLIGQLDIYFRTTKNGQTRALRVVPEPFFVHSDLTTGVKVADIIAYVVSWGYRDRLLSRPRREELAPYAAAVRALRYDARRKMPVPGRRPRPFFIRSIKVIPSLRRGNNAALHIT